MENSKKRKRREMPFIEPRLDQEICTVKQFCFLERAFPEGGVRWGIFKNGKELEACGAIVRAGSRVLVNRSRYIAHAIGEKAAA